jgi:hypothetical protein
MPKVYQNKINIQFEMVSKKEKGNAENHEEARYSAQACNASYSEGGDWEDGGSSVAQANSS